MAYNIFEDLLDRDEFGFETNNPDSEVTSEKKVITQADGSSIETIVKSPNNTPTKRAEQEGKVGFAQAAQNKTATSTKVTGASTGGSPRADHYKAMAAEQEAGDVLRAENKVVRDKYNTQVSLFDQGLLTDKPTSPYAPGGNAPRSTYAADVKEKSETARQVAEYSGKSEEIAAALESGAITQEQATAANTTLDSAFDQTTTPVEKTIPTVKEVGTANLERRNELMAEGATAAQILKGSDTLGDDVQKEAAAVIAETPGGDKALEQVIDKLKGTDNPEGMFDGILSFFKDNPVLGQAILSAAAGFLATGSLYQGVAAGLQGFAGGLQSQAANAAAGNDAQIKAAKVAADDEKFIVGLREKFTAESIAKFEKTGVQTDLIDKGPTKSVISGKPSGTKYIDGNKVDFWQAEDGNTYFKGPKGETLQAAGSFTAQEDYDAKFHSKAARADRADAWSKQLSTEIASEIPSTDEYMPGVNSGRILQGMNTYAKKYNKDIGNFSIADRTAIKRAAEDMVAENKLRADRGLPLEKNFNKYIESAIIRSDGLDAGVPVGAFITSGTEDVNEAAMSEAYSVIRNGTKVDGRTETELWAIAATQYEALGQKKIEGMEEDGADHKMSGFLYFLTNLDFSKS